MKPISQGMNASLFLRITGVLCIVLLLLFACFVGTVLVAYVVGLLFSMYSP